MCLRPETVCLCKFSTASDLSFDRFNLTCSRWGVLFVDDEGVRACEGGSRTLVQCPTAHRHESSNQ